MDIKKVLLREHPSHHTQKLVNYIDKDPERFKQLIDIFFAGPYRVTQRASWALSCCVDKNPSLLLHHIKVIINVLNEKDTPVAVKRNIIRLLQFVEIPKKYYGVLVDRCFELMDPKEPIAIRVFSMTVLGNIAQHLPDLKNELELVIEDQLPYASAGYLSRAKKVLKDLKK